MFNRQRFQLAYIGREEFSSAPAVGFPVPSAALIACTFLARREGAEGTTKGEGRGCNQPYVPLGCIKCDHLRSPVQLIDEHIFLYSRVVPTHDLASLILCIQVPVTEQYTRCSVTRQRGTFPLSLYYHKIKRLHCPAKSLYFPFLNVESLTVFNQPSCSQSSLIPGETTHDRGKRFHARIRNDEVREPEQFASPQQVLDNLIGSADVDRRH